MERRVFFNEPSSARPARLLIFPDRLRAAKRSIRHLDTGGDAATGKSL